MSNHGSLLEMMMNKLSLLVLIILLSACAEIKPWVKPYERDNLADPIMNFGRLGIANAYMNHMYQSREAARGAEGGSGGGCGCN